MTCHYATLSSEALLHINGPDTLTFLQGQTTCDTRTVDAHSSTLGAYCTPQGRVVCDFLLAELAAEHFVLRMRRDIREDAAQTFGKYIVFSKAELAQTDDWQLCGIWGDTAGDQLAALFPQTPSGYLTSAAGDDFVLIQTDAAGKQFEAYLSVNSPHLDRLAAALAEQPESEWRQLQIQAGIARVEAGTSGELVPQVLNYDLTGHISFSKGCYTGQEVVARLHYRGRSKRRTYLAELPRPATAGEPLFGDTEQSVGEVINCLETTPHQALVAVTQNALAGGLHLESPQGPALTLGELPYSIDNDPDSD